MTITELILIFHVLGAGVVIGIAFFSVVLTIKSPILTEKIQKLGWIGKFGMWASIWQFVTGVYLASHEWSEFRGSKIFWIKIGLYVIEGAMASILFGRQVKNAQEGKSNKLGLVVLTWAVAIGLIAALGVLLVEDHR